MKKIRIKKNLEASGDASPEEITQLGDEIEEGIPEIQDAMATIEADIAEEMYGGSDGACEVQPELCLAAVVGIGAALTGVVFKAIDSFKSDKCQHSGVCCNQEEGNSCENSNNYSSDEHHLGTENTAFVVNLLNS